MKSGTGPTRQKYTDYDFLKSHKHLFGAVVTFPTEFFTDAGFGMPDQMADGQPFGCTNYAQAELANNLTGVRHNPADLEAVTHANVKGGYDMRASFDAARKIGWFTQYFNIRPSGSVNAFWAFKLAQISAGIDPVTGKRELRSLSVGMPWFPSWEDAALKGQGLMPFPKDAELSLIRKDPKIFGWHDSVMDGFTSRDGVSVYRDKSFQGTRVGENGYIYFDEPTINTVMAIKGTFAGVGSRNTVENPLRVDLTAVAWIVSYIRNFLGLE